MKPTLCAILTLTWFLWFERASAADGDALAEYIKQKSALVERDHKRPGAPIVRLFLRGPRPSAAVLQDIGKLRDLESVRLYPHWTDDVMLKAAIDAGLLLKLDVVRGDKGQRPTKAEDVVALSVAYPMITHRALGLFAPFKNLRELTLADNKFTIEAAKELRTFEMLQELTISFTYQTDGGDALRELAKLPSLKRLAIFGQLRGADMRLLKDFKVLESVRLPYVSYEMVRNLSEEKLLHLLFEASSDKNGRAKTDAEVRALDLSRLSGFVPESLKHLNGLTELESLRLPNGFQGTDASMRSLSTLQSLRSLTMGSSLLTVDGYRLVGSLKALRELHLYQPQLRDESFTALSTLKDLRTLSIEDHSPRPRLTPMGLLTLASFPELTELHLKGNGIVFDGTTIDAISGLKKLERLSVASGSVTDKDIGKLTRLKELRELSLFRSAVTEAGIKKLAPLSRSLTRLTLPDRLTDAMMVALDEGGLLHTQGVPEVGKEPRTPGDIVEIPSISPHLTDVGLKSLAAYSNLREINLSNNRNFSDAGLTTLGSFSKLRSATLANQRVGPLTAMALKQCRELERLIAPVTKINDEALGALSECKKLRLLDVSYCPVTDAGLDPLAALKNLEKLYLSGTKVTPAGAAKLRAAMPWCEVLGVD